MIMLFPRIKKTHTVFETEAGSIRGASGRRSGKNLF